MKAKDLIKILEKDPEKEVLVMNSSICSTGNDGDEGCPCFDIDFIETIESHFVIQFDNAIFIDPIYNITGMKESGLSDKDIKLIHDSIEEKIPGFVFLAKDELSIQALDKYLAECKRLKCDPNHIKGIQERIDQFEAWQQSNEKQVKIPD